MKDKKLLRAIGDIDDRYIEEADADAKPRRFPLYRFAALAASVCVVIGCVIALLSRPSTVVPSVSGTEPMETSPDTAPETFPDIMDGRYPPYFFIINGDASVEYYALSIWEALRYELLIEGATTVSDETLLPITEADLGERMGTVTGGSLHGCTVHHAARYPSLDSICIVDTPDGYLYYTASWLTLEDAIGQNSDAVLAAYGLPDFAAEAEVLSGEGEVLLALTEAETREILAILADKTNIGMAENNRLYANLWQDTYGNDDIYYDEESGTVREKNIPTERKTYTYTTEDGVTVAVEVNGNTDVYELKSALFHTGQRQILIATDRGFYFTVTYTPSIRTCSVGDGYYRLSEAESARMNTLLKIEQ
ncbi:MAG: hypothetical protein IJZ08_09465 [Clostridia bacterium]|nr:hypothetical protein [Clostridia bacterium]